MGYFSNLVCEHQEYYPDHSITEPKQQLLWRVEELQERLETLKAKGATYSSSVCYALDDLRYMLPVHFRTVFDTEKAIDLAVAELKNTYGIDLYPEYVEEPIVDEITENQMTFFILLPGIPARAAA